jgi:hypothetical protein
VILAGLVGDLSLHEMSYNLPVSKIINLLKDCDKFYYAIQIENFSLTDLPPSLLHIVYVQLEMV